MKTTHFQSLCSAVALATLLATGARAALPVASGSYVGDGTDGRPLSGLGFAPQVVFVRAEAAGPLVVRTATIGGDKSKVLVAGDLQPKMIVEMGSDGFTLGDDPAVNGPLTTYHWVALGDGAGLVAGAYTGTGVDGEAIEVGFRPEYVLVVGEDPSSGAAQRFAAQTGAGSLGFLGAGVHTDDITAFTATGFQLGTGVDVNRAGWHYHYLALGGAGGSVATGTYTGDGGLLREVDAGGLPPSVVLLARQEAGAVPWFRTTQVTALFSLPATAVPPVTDGITSQSSTGFGVGAAANATGGRYHWLALRDLGSLEPADLGVTCAVADATPTEGEVASFTVRVDNLGPGAVSSLALDCPLPAGLAFAGAASSHGSYSPATGVWSVDTLAAGSTATLTLGATALPGTAGSTQTLAARIARSSAPDPIAQNDGNSVEVVVWRRETRVVSGTYIGNGAASRAIRGTGFQPDLVLVKATTAVGGVLRTRTMAGDASKDMFGATAIAANRVRSLDPDGFTVGSDPTVNQAGITYYWTAVLEAPGQLHLGTFTGSGADDRSLTGLGFQPEYVLVASAGSRTPYQRFADQTGDASLAFAPAAEVTDHIQALEPDGFQLGASADVNAAGVLHHYVAVDAVAGVAAIGSFNGNASDNRDIILPGFQPELVLLQRPGWSPVERPQAVTGDLTLPFVASAAFSNGVQALLPAGFQVGSSAWVNGSGVRSHFLALRSSGTDLALSASVDDATPDVGQAVELRVNLRNLGPLAASGIEVESPVPAGVTLHLAGPSQGTYAAATGRWSVGSLAPGDSASLVLTATIDAGTQGTSLLHSARIATASASDPVPGNDSTSVSFRVPVADLRLRATVDDATPTEGEDVTFSVTVTNLGPDSAATVKAAVALPPRVAFLGAGSSQGSYDAGTGTWQAGSIAPGGSASLALRVEPDAGSAGGDAWLRAAVATATFDPSAANDADSTRLRVQPGDFRVVTGSYVGNGASGREIAGVGFQPDLLLVRGANASPTVAASKTMVGGGSKDLGSSTALATGRVLSLTADGFVVGSNASVNAAGVTYHWTAFLEAQGQMKVGSYIGNASDDRSITGLGFPPGYVMVMGSGAQASWQRFASESGDASLPFAAGNEQNDRIQRFLADGFEVGSRSDVNANGTVFHYAAWSQLSPRVGGASYGGDGRDDRPMVAGFRPGLLWIKREDSQPAVWRSGSVTGDVTLPATSAAPLADGIQSFETFGFHLGAAAAVNEDGRTYHWAGFRDVTTVGVGVGAATALPVVDAGGTAQFQIRAFNHGPLAATGVAVAVGLPPELPYRSHVAGAGTFDAGGGLWRIPAISAGDTVTLDVTADVAGAACGDLAPLTATLTAVDQDDATLADDQDRAAVHAACADVAVSVAADFPTRNEGDPVTIVVTARNRGPDSATDVVVSNALPSGLTWTGAAPGQGTFSLADGIWFTGSLAPADSAQLVLAATVDGGTGGTTLLHVATVDARENDPAPGDRADSAAIHVSSGAGIDLFAAHPAARAVAGDSAVAVLEVTVLNPSAQARTLDRIALANRTRGPAPQEQLDAELGPLRLIASNAGGATGSFGPRAAGGGVVEFDGLGLVIAAGSFVGLRFETTVPADAADGDSLDLAVEGPASLTFDQPVTYSAPWPVDPPGAVAVDGMAASRLSARAVPGDEIEIGERMALVADLTLPANGYQPDVLTGLRVENGGSASPTTDVERLELWSDGGDGAFTGAGDDTLRGALAWDGAAWSATGLALPIRPPGRRVFLAADVAEAAGVGGTLRFVIPTGGVTVGSGNDGPIDAPFALPDTLRLRGHRTSVAAWALASPQSALLPGRDGEEIYRLALLNQEAAPETLRALALTNLAGGPGGPAELDASWLPLRLMRGATEVAVASFASGRAVFATPDLVLAQGDTVVLSVTTGASLAARDGDLLDLALAGGAGLEFSRPVTVAAGTLDPPGGRPVDGMALAQVALGGGGVTTLLIGSVRNPVLDVTVPANGYQADTLRFLMVRNSGTAEAVTDLPRLEAWADDGDGVAEPGSDDARLGALIYTGEQTWILAGLALPVPVGGRRLFVTCDVAAGAAEGGTVRMHVTTTPVAGFSLASGNDGPVDGEASAPSAAVISAADRILVTVAPTAGGVAGAADSVALLRIVVRSTYSDSARTLTGLTLANATRGAGGGTQADRDGNIQALHLHADGPAGPVLATTFFTGGRAAFSGFHWSVPPGGERVLYLDAEISNRAADADVIAVEVANDAGFLFWVPVSMAGDFPLASAEWTVDGVRAGQIGLPAARPAALGADDGPALAFELVVPRNGYRDDVLEGVRLENAGTADATQLRELRLWKDGGDGAYGAGAGDDADLGAMSWTGSRWVSAALSEPVGAAGLRLFATVSTSPAIQDSASVQLRLPVNGLNVASGNDGPTDRPLVSDAAVLLSTSELLASFALDAPATVTGDTVFARLTVRNTGGQALLGVAPSPPLSSGTGAVTLLSGPTPPAQDLAPGAQGTFSWAYRADATGTVAFATSAQGAVQGTGAQVRSLIVATAAADLLTPASGVRLYATESLPFSISRGQIQVVPLTLTLSNPGGADGADAFVRRATFRIEDETGGPVVPADLLRRAVISEGVNVYAEVADLPLAGSTVDFVFDRPARVESAGASGGQVTLSLSLDISDTTRVPSFRVVVDGEASFAAEDAVCGRPVPVEVTPPLAYPVRSGLARISAGGTQLDIAGAAEAQRVVGRGQAGVDLAHLTLTNPGPVLYGPDVRLSAMAVTLVDSAGAVVPRPADYLARIRVSAPPLSLLDRAVTAAEDSVLVLALVPSLSLPINTPVAVTLAADLAPAGPTGAFRLRLADTSRFVARNASTGAVLPVIPSPAVLEGVPIVVQERADSLLARSTPSLPETLAVGTRDVAAMTIALRHPGGAGVGAIRCDALVLRCRDPFNAPLPPATFLDAVRVSAGGIEAGSLAALPAQGSEFAIPLAGVAIEPGGEVALEVVIGVEVSAPLGAFAVTFGADGVAAFDQNLGSAVGVAPDHGLDFPFTSGVARLESPPRELAAAFADALPAALAADGSEFPAGRLTLRNTAPSGEIRVDRLEVAAADGAYAAVALGTVATRVRAYVADTLWAETPALDAGAATGVLAAAAPLVVAAGVPVAVELRIVPAATAGETGFRIGLAASGIGVVQPGGTLFTVSVVAEQGASFPFWTAVGSLSPTELPASYSSFPNPFAAGRDRSRFVYYLRAPGRVTLRLWTARGEAVCTLLDGAPQPAGLRQETFWDGRNGRGAVVVSGAYVAEIVVAYDDGTTERALHKVAVVR